MTVELNPEHPSFVPEAVAIADQSLVAAITRRLGEGWKFGPTKIYVGAVDPGAGTDSDAGFAVGSPGVNTATGAVFVLIDATPGAAVWIRPVLPGDEAITDFAYVSISGDVTLGAAHRGKRLWVTAAATITLGDPAAQGGGYAGGIVRKSNGAVTVTAPGRLINGKAESYSLVGEDQGALFEIGPDGEWHLSGDVEAVV